MKILFILAASLALQAPAQDRNLPEDLTGDPHAIYLLYKSNILRAIPWRDHDPGVIA